jgi:hypothetical protein
MRTINEFMSSIQTKFRHPLIQLIVHILLENTLLDNIFFLPFKRMYGSNKV